nr:hypothetical protein Iba_chr02aCG15380 [Ipomoea batatas]
MFLEPPNAVSVHSDHRRRAMDGEEQHHLREVPPNVASRHRIRDPHRLAGRIHRACFRVTWALWKALQSGIDQPLQTTHRRKALQFLLEL